MGWGFRNLGFGEREDSGESEGERADGERVRVRVTENMV